MSTNETLLKLATEHGLSAERLAALLLVSKRTAERWLSSQRHCPPGVVALLELLLKERTSA